jgi:hypothetical protein
LIKVKKSAITIGRLAEMLSIRFRTELKWRLRIERRLAAEMGIENIENKENSPVAIAIDDAVNGYVSKLMARRLKRNDRSVPLLVSADLDGAKKSVLAAIEAVNGPLQTKDREEYTRLLETTAGLYVKGIFQMVPSDQNPYDVIWRWIAIVENMCAEHSDMSLLAIVEVGNDEIVRRMYPKEVYVFLLLKMLEVISNVEAMLHVLLDTKEDSQLAKQLEALMPMIRQQVANAKQIAIGWIMEEADRIYGA